MKIADVIIIKPVACIFKRTEGHIPFSSTRDKDFLSKDVAARVIMSLLISEGHKQQREFAETQVFSRSFLIYEGKEWHCRTKNKGGFVSQQVAVM